MSELEKCAVCRQPLNPGMRQCVNRKCRVWNVRASVISPDESTVLLSDARMGRVERVKTGLVDLVWGGGIAKTSVTQMGGEPGAGKTTLCLQLCDVFAEKVPDREALYIANEQDATELKDTAERLTLRHKNRIRIVKAMGGIPNDLGDLVLHFKPSLIILDSVTKWTGEDLPLAVLIAQRMKDYTVRLNAPTILINQITKGGDLAGLKALEHAVDMACIFEILEEETDKQGNPLPKNQSPRRLMSRKNRFGPAPEEQFYSMTGEGLTECWPLEMGWTGERPPYSVE